jgi:hypothetical protein
MMDDDPSSGFPSPSSGPHSPPLHSLTPLKKAQAINAHRISDGWRSPALCTTSLPLHSAPTTSFTSSTVPYHNDPPSPNTAVAKRLSKQDQVAQNLSKPSPQGRGLSLSGGGSFSSSSGCGCACGCVCICLYGSGCVCICVCGCGCGCSCGCGYVWVYALTVGYTNSILPKLDMLAYGMRIACSCGKCAILHPDLQAHN